MDLKGLRGSDIVFDIESGMTTSEEPTWDVKQEKQLLNGDRSGLANEDREVRTEDPVDAGNTHITCVDFPAENGASKKFGGEDNIGGGDEKKMEGEKPKKKKAYRKHPKPPRPPQAPSLDAADLKLIKEISKLTMLKRARMERIKALKKMKNTKASSSRINLCTLFITILFCLVIVWQVAGLCSGSHSNVQFEGSPESSIGHRGAFISVQYFRNVSPSSDGSTSASTNIIR